MSVDVMMMMMMMAAERVDFGLPNGLFLFVLISKTHFLRLESKTNLFEEKEEDEEDEARFLSSSLAPLFGETTTASQSAPRL